MIRSCYLLRVCRHGLMVDGLGACLAREMIAGTKCLRRNFIISSYRNFPQKSSLVFWPGRERRERRIIGICHNKSNAAAYYYRRKQATGEERGLLLSPHRTYCFRCGKSAAVN